MPDDGKFVKVSSPFVSENAITIVASTSTSSGTGAATTRNFENYQVKTDVKHN